MRYTTLFKTKHEKALQNLLAVDVDVLNLELEGVEEDFPGKWLGFFIIGETLYYKNKNSTMVFLQDPQRF